MQFTIFTVPVLAGEHGGSTWIIEIGSNRQAASATLSCAQISWKEQFAHSLTEIALSCVVDIDAISGTLCESVQVKLETYTARTPGLHDSRPRLQTLEKGQTAVAAGAQRAMQLVA